MSGVTPDQAANTIREALGEPAREAVGEDGITLVYTDHLQRNGRVKAALAALKVLEDAANERDAVMRALGEPCAECGHIDWRSDDKAQDPLHEMAARADAAVRRAEQAERERDERMTKESGRALIEDAQRWQRAYEKARDELAEQKEASVNYLVRATSAEARADTLTRVIECFHDEDRTGA